MDTFVEPFDRGSFLVKSRSREGSHVVDIETITCTCEAFILGKQKACFHMKMVLNYVDNPV